MQAARERWLKPKNPKLDTSSPGLKVLAAGLWRCQTSSLHHAFENILTEPHPSALSDSEQGNAKRPLYPAMHGSLALTSLPLLKLCCAALQEQDRFRRQRLLHQIFDGYNASSDFPGMAFVDDICEMYPEARIVLNTRRSPEAWARSADTLYFFSTWRYLICCVLIPKCRWHWRMYREYRKMARRRFADDELDIWSTNYYEKHNEWVKQIVREKTGKEVLEWEASMGWRPLCEFVGVDVPPNTEIPRSNDAHEIQILKRILICMGLLSWAVLFIVVGGLWYGIKFFFAS